LGANSALPAHGRYPSAQILSTATQSFLIDCGEGTQIRMSDLGVKRGRINHIFISHLHGDHVYGLPGLLSSLNHFGREEKLCVYGPSGIKLFLEQIFVHSGVHLIYPLDIIEIDPVQGFNELLKTEDVTVFSFPLVHRLPTRGYLFRWEASQLNLDAEAVRAYSLSFEERRKAKLGEDIFRDGERIANAALTHAKEPAVTYAYCSDTIKDERIAGYVKKADLLYHEATFLDSLKHKAVETKHSTAKEAAEIAHLADVKKLMIGHYSSRYKSLEGHLTEAREVFANTILAEEGLVVDIP